MSSNKFAGLFTDSEDEDGVKVTKGQEKVVEKQSKSNNQKTSNKGGKKSGNRGGNSGGGGKSYGGNYRDEKSRRRDDNTNNRRNKQRNDKRGKGQNDRRSRNGYRENRGGRDAKKGGHQGWGTDSDVVKDAQNDAYDEREQQKVEEEEEEEDSGITFEEYQKSLKGKKKSGDLFEKREVRAVENDFKGMSVMQNSEKGTEDHPINRKKKTRTKKKAKRTIQAEFSGHQSEQRGHRDDRRGGRGRRERGRRNDGRKTPNVKSESDFPTLG